MTTQKGIYPDHKLHEFVEKEYIQSSMPIDENSIGPSSLDLTLNGRIFKTVGSSTPKAGEPVMAMLEKISSGRKLREIEPNEEGAYELDKGIVYVAELNESLDLPEYIQGRANPRSCVGRLDILVRVMADGVTLFDTIPPNYRGKLYLEIYSSEFNIEVRNGYALSQLRLHTKGDIQEFTLTEGQLKKLVENPPYLLVDKNGGSIKDPIIGESGLFLTSDLDCVPVAYKAKHVNRDIDILADEKYYAEDFWDPVEKDEYRYIALDKTDFFVMKSKEHIIVPPEYAIEIVPHNERLVEARVHYAGFAHPGFGYTADSRPRGTPLIFEVRSRDAPIALRDEKPLAKLYYNRMYEEPEIPYNKRTNSFGTQGLKLSPCFKPWGAKPRIIPQD
ncbi:MAG: 2'-deoxycytidine 5'-triphosphate deaminase [Candidatus Aenigmarchaeota archaeon]|nr:2'-deoxycytidine 5'-triphosphate deaminase [Candidatus Aenigmarchaeota archaeon]MDI6722530.1 2'-deoxycytidine 5'-triphosphate deaminase [Candidatus Aenigmarchaeota archaeon]